MDGIILKHDEWLYIPHIHIHHVLSWDGLQVIHGPRPRKSILGSPKKV